MSERGGGGGEGRGVGVGRGGCYFFLVIFCQRVLSHL